MTLEEFLAARLAEDEIRAKAALDEWDDEAARYEWEDLPTDSYVHARNHDPARVIREVEAKRAILAEHALTVTRDVQYKFSPHTGERIPESWSVECQACGWCSDNPTSACLTVRALAAVYSDHPDYDPAWKA